MSRRQPPAGLQSYLEDSHDSRIQSMLASQSHLPPSKSYPSYYGAERSSIGTSQLVSGSTCTAGSLPGLSSAASTSNRSYTGTESSHGGGGMTNIWLLEDQGGVLQTPSPPRMVSFECPFNFLNCARVFPNSEEWYHHSLTHFGSAGPPNSSQCCLCDAHFHGPSGSDSWYQRMHHIATEHHRNGERLSTARADFGLYEYLWRIRVISEADHMRLKGPQGAQSYPSQSGSPYQSGSANTSNAYTVSSRSRARGGAAHRR